LVKSSGSIFVIEWPVTAKDIFKIMDWLGVAKYFQKMPCRNGCGLTQQRLISPDKMANDKPVHLTSA